MNDSCKSNTLPTTMTIGDRTYEILEILREGEKSIVGYEIDRRAKGMNACLGQDDGQYLLDHRQDIPESLKRKVYFVFTCWHPPYRSDSVYWVGWDGCCWLEHESWFGSNRFFAGLRVLRRIK